MTLDQLHDQHSTLVRFLEEIKTPPEQMGEGLRITVSIYIRILQDAISVLNSLIDHLSPEGSKKPHHRDPR